MKGRCAWHTLANQVSLFTTLLLMRFGKGSVMVSHIANLEGLFTQLVSTRLVMNEPHKVALLLVTLSKHKD